MTVEDHDKLDRLIEEVRESCDELKLKMFFLMLEEVKKQVIGYHKMSSLYTEKPLPVIRQEGRNVTTIEVLRSLGCVTETRELQYYIPFPEKKSLHDMIKHGDKFKEWCDKNL